MIEAVIWFVVALILIVAEYYLATKLRSPLWGGILPLAVLGYTVYVFAVQHQAVDMQTIMPYAIVNILLFGEWSSGREAYRELQCARQDDRQPGDGRPG